MPWALSKGASAFLETKARPQAAAITQRTQQRDPTPYEAHIRAFNMVPFGHPFKHEFLIEIYRDQWPDFFILEKDGVVNDWCIRRAMEFCRSKRISMMGCASSGKTFDAAMYGYTLWKAKPMNTSVYLSTTSGEAGEARMWGAVKDLFARDKYQIGKRLDSLQLICLDQEVKDEDGVKQRDFRDVIKCVKIKQGQEGRNVIGTICGRKNDNVLWVCDEENYMDGGVLDARVNLFSNTFAQFIGIGNAPDEGSPLYIDAEPHGPDYPDGWRSVDKDAADMWPTKSGVCLYFNGERSPNFNAPDPMKPPFPKLMNARLKGEIMTAAMGEDTNIFWSQFYGFPPSVDVPNKVLTHKLLETHGAFKEPEWLGEAIKGIAGMDCGFREDGDPSILDCAKIGKDVTGKTVVAFERDGIVLHPKQNSEDPFEKQMASRALDELVKRDIHDMAIDISGDGGMTALALKEEARERNWKLNVVAISSMGAADDKITVPGEKRTAQEQFDRKVSQIWMSFRVSVGNGVVRGMDPHCNAVQQLCSRRFNTDEKKRFAVEKKADMKKRLKRSPDHADARCYAHFLALSMGLSGKQAAKPVKVDIPGGTGQPEARQRYASHGTSSRYQGR